MAWVTTTLPTIVLVDVNVDVADAANTADVREKLLTAANALSHELLAPSMAFGDYTFRPPPDVRRCAAVIGSTANLIVNLLRPFLAGGPGLPHADGMAIQSALAAVVEDEMRVLGRHPDGALNAPPAIAWQPDPLWSHGERVLAVRAELPDPGYDTANFFRLAVLAKLDGTAATWNVWGNRRGVNVSDAADTFEGAKAQAARVYHAITRGR